MKTLYVSDLDDTLLHDDGNLSVYTIEVVNDLIKKGMHFTLATGRSIESTLPICQKLHLHLPIIVYNGGCMMDPDSGDILYYPSLSRKECIHILKMLDPAKTWIYQYQNEKEACIRYDTLKEEDFQHVYQIEYRDCRDTLSSLYHYFEEKGYSVMRYDKDGSDCLSITTNQISKGRTIKELKENEGYERVIGFGDAISDLDMFAVCDVCYAVENAVDEVKKTADGIIASNEDDGVAKWLRTHAM